MGKTWLGGRNGGTAWTTNNSSRYIPIMGTIENETSANDICNMTWRITGDFWDLSVWVATNTRTTNCTVRFYINGAATGPTLTIPPGVTGWITWANPLTDKCSITAGDVVCLVISTLGSGGTIAVGGVSVAFEGASSVTGLTFRSNDALVSTGHNAQRSFLQGAYASASTESDFDLIMRAAGTFSYAGFRITPNTLSPSVAQLRSRKNEADGNQAINLTSGQTGIFFDTVNSDHIDSGDRFNIRLQGSNAGSGGSFQSQWVQGTFISDATDFELGGVYGQTSNFIDASNPTYWPMFSDRRISFSAEADAQIAAPFEMWISNLRAKFSGIAPTNTFTFGLRVNGVLSALQATLTGANAKGENTVDVVHVQKGDLLSIVNTAPGTGSRVMKYLYVKVDSQPPPSANARRRPMYAVGQ